MEVLVNPMCLVFPVSLNFGGSKVILRLVLFRNSLIETCHISFIHFCELKTTLNIHSVQSGNLKRTVLLLFVLIMI